MDLDSWPVGAFELFQEFELWNKILGYLKDPYSYPSVYGTCPLFQELLEERVFTEIFKILKETKYLHLHSSISETKRQLYLTHRTDLPQTAPKLASFCRKENKDVWKLREISKSFKFMIESLFMNEFDGPDWLGKFQKIIPSSDHENHYNPHKLVLSTSWEIASADRALKSSSLAFLYLQAVHVIIRGPPIRSARAHEVLEQEILGFFQNYGNSISGVIFECGPGLTEWEEYKYFVNLMKHCGANLKALVFKIIDRFDNDGLTLPGFLERNPFPKLESLEFLSFQCRQLNTVWITEFLRNCPNLKYLKLPTSQSYNNPGFLNLLRNTNLEYYMVEERTLSHCQLFPNWSLKTLILGDWQPFKLDTSFFRSLEQGFGKTLEHLEIRLADVDDILCAVGRQLILPRLKTLYLGELNAKFCRLDCITSLMSLEYLKIESVVGHDSADRRNFSIGGLNENNIWRRFEHLKKIKVGYLEETQEGKKINRFTYHRQGRKRNEI